MKWIIITLLLSLQITAFAQEEDNYTFLTEKQTYKVGETITAKLTSKKSFTLATDGDCSSSALAPSFIKKINGKWQESYAMRQMCCGLPCTMNPINEMNPQITLEITGTFKMIIYTCSGTVMSNAFTVEE